MTFRKFLFWLHLAAGLIAGLSIAIMCFTGTVLAFEKQIVAWSERDARLVEVPAPGTPRLSLDELSAAVRAHSPDAKPTAITVSADPRAAVTFALGRNGALYANPYTGEIRTPASTKVHDFMHVMEDWHRWLALSGDNRPIGKAINGACNVAFFVLAVTGLYLWMPRNWSWRSVRAVALFNPSASGKARDFNWHNVIGLWSAPILIVLTLTALPISYRWAGNLIYTLAGEEAPAPGPGGMAGAPVQVPTPPAGVRPLGRDELLSRIQISHTSWTEITLRLAAPGRGGPPAGAPGAGNATRQNRPAGGDARAGETRPAVQPATFVVKTPGAWPRTASTTVSLDPFTGDELRTDTFASLSTGRKIRTWTRFLHTGEALGVVGQFLAGVASLGGCFLVYTGVALSWRRFFRRKKAAA
ncbi:MAG: PepSY domain-containing protein [Opitutus sp.]|nr:PepSY domain-containing protein [Opitutus sp.]